ncbi:MAG: 4-(cytidine 5'-diphospho)-2-C-methyl-D-erythritol kinase, partial [Albidovulum sp.]
MAIEVTAPAKVNLALHVTGRRPDGYHLLDSLVVFADIGDRLRFEPAAGLSLAVTGPFAEGVPVDGSNLVLKAAALMAGPGARITLEKHLPHGGGIGGGSSDAAAALRALA